MGRIRVFLSVVTAVFLLALPVVAQEGGGNVAVVYCVKAQPGKTAQFEAAAKKHMDWHRVQNDSWTWLAWNVISGKDAGSYCWGSFGHAWADFDNPGVSAEADSKDWANTGGQFEQSGSAVYWTLLPGVSKPSGGEEPMHSVIFFHARFGMEEAFAELVGEFHKAIEKANMPWNYEWYMLTSGGDLGTYALVFPRANFAAMQESGKTFPQVLEEAYGKAGAGALLAKWGKVVKGADSHLTQARPDLSHIPEGQ